VHKDLLTLFNRVTFPVSSTGTRVEPSHVDVFNTEIATLGYTFNGVCLERMREMTRGDFSDLRKRVLGDLTEITGADKRHQTLFARFPHSTPNQHEYLLQRVIGYMQDALNYEPKNFQVLSCGHVIDLDIFDLREFGACPICQHQVDQIPWMRNRGNMPFQRLTPLKTIAYADDAMLGDLGNALLARNSSLSATEKAFLRAVSDRVNLRLPEKLFKETLPFAYTLFGAQVVQPHLSGATDVLRILVHVSDPENGDLSLATSTKLTLGKGHVKDALRMLDGLRNVEADLMRHRGRWKIFARDAHVGKRAYRARFPNATAAFDKLLSDEKRIATFGRQVEPWIRARNVTGLLVPLSDRPGEFMRKLDFMLRNSRTPVETSMILEALVVATPEVTTKLLLEVKKYLEHRDTAVGQRVFLPKGAMNKAQIVADKRKPIRDEDLLRAIDLIDMELQGRLGRLPSMGRVYVDPALKKVLIPYNRRGDSASNVAWPKGSRFPISENAEVLRMFVHWKGMVDVDLSAVSISEHFEVIEQVSWTRLRGDSMHHSGDIQRAPNGASEFIDARIAAFKPSAGPRRARYLAISVISFSGQTFDTFPAFAGFMERNGLNSGEVYEPQALALKFDLSGKVRSYMPLMFDIQEREVVYVDLSTGGGRHQRVAAQGEKFQALARMVVDLPNTKPTVYDVVMAHATARGKVVDRPEQADVVFQREGLDIEAIMAMTA
jgi:hypothetical protein